MVVQSSWLNRGYFALGNEQPTVTQQIRDELCKTLRLPADGLHIANYPVGPVWRHTYWWREGIIDYIEAQFFLQISLEYPVLSLGVSVEKGFEDSSITKHESQQLVRDSWDWQQLVNSATDVVEEDIPAIADRLKQPVTVRFRRHDHNETILERRAFTVEFHKWHERRKGQAGTQLIAEYISELDKFQNQWVIAHAAIDLSPSVAQGMSAGEIASLLVQFEPLRKRLRRR
jgi:hypothetical protein